MKPIIYWYPDGGCYICELHQSYFDEDFDEQEYRILCLAERVRLLYKLMKIGLGIVKDEI